MVKLTGLFSQLSKVKVAVIGDFMLDTYTIGKAKRISPEAPVAVVNVLTEEQRAGGAGNVVLNLLSMGASVLAIGRIGSDHAGEQLKDIFKKEGVSTEGLFTQNEYQTPVKNRIIAENQQIVRIDYEKSTALSEEMEEKILQTLPELLCGIDVITLSDYAKGFLSQKLLQAITEYAATNKCIVIADPKGVDFSKYNGATIIKPNLSEVYAAANVPMDMPLEVAVSKVMKISDVSILMVTRSEAGISIFFREGERYDFPVRVHEVKDVTGAGDTVLAMLACCLASGLDIRDAIPFCNLAASIAIERFGCARISLSDLARKMLELDSGNKVFDCEHIFALQQALKGEKVSALNLQHCKDIDLTIFQLIKDRGNRPGHYLIVFLGEINPASFFVNILKELIAVNYILIGSMDFLTVCQTLEIEEMDSVYVGYSFSNSR